MRRIERTKENIGVSGLDTQTRKKLFNEFIDAGGEVIKEKDERGLSSSDRELQKRYRQQLKQVGRQYKLSQDRSKSDKKTSRGPADTKSKYTLSEATKDAKNISPARLLLQRLNIRLRLFFMKVTDFTGCCFAPKFLRSFDDEYLSSLLSAQMTFVSLFKHNIRTGQKIIEQLDNMHPVYFELIELLSNISDRTIANEILEHYYNFPDILQETMELQEPLTKMFRRLHPLNPYREFILTGLEKALYVQTRIEKKKFSFYSTGRRKAKNNIYIIFNKLYPRLYWLMCFYEGRIFVSEDDINDTLGISADDMPGKRKRNALKTLEQLLENNTPEDNEAEETQAKKEEKEIIIPDPVKKGLAIMQKIDQVKYNENYSKNNVFKLLSKNDKLYVTSIIFDEFEKEYSLILTTNKIKYFTVSRSSENMNYKGKFASMYNEIGKCKSRIKDYAIALAAYKKLKEEKPISSTQYIEYSNRLSALEKGKKQTGTDARMYVKAFLEKLNKELKILMDDMNNNRNIVINPEDIIMFETDIEGEKKLNGRTVCEAITCAHDYSTAFIYRLSHQGDLSGELEFEEGAANIFDSVNLKENIPPKEENKKNPGRKESILKELDDII